MAPPVAEGPAGSARGRGDSLVGELDVPEMERWGRIFGRVPAGVVHRGELALRLREREPAGAGLAGRRLERIEVGEVPVDARLHGGLAAGDGAVTGHQGRDAAGLGDRAQGLEGGSVD